MAFLTFIYYVWQRLIAPGASDAQSLVTAAGCTEVTPDWTARSCSDSGGARGLVEMDSSVIDFRSKSAALSGPDVPYSSLSVSEVRREKRFDSLFST